MTSASANQSIWVSACQQSFAWPHLRSMLSPLSLSSPSSPRFLQRFWPQFSRAFAAVATAATATTVTGLGCRGAPAKPISANLEKPGVEKPRIEKPRVESPKQVADVGMPMLWRVNGDTGPSYLLGTIHLGVHTRELSPAVFEALATTTTFISEANLSENINPIEIAQLATLPPGKDLETMIGEPDFGKLAGLMGLPTRDLRHLQPWSAYTSVLQQLYPSETSMDAILHNKASIAGQRLVYLEDWHSQLAILSEIIDSNDLKLILDPSSEDRRLLDEVVAAYRRGDFPTLSTLISGPLAVAKDPAQFKLLFEDRNRAWLPLLVPHLRRGRTFVAVGAGHYVSSVGLLALLEKAGLPATRVGQQR